MAIFSPSDEGGKIALGHIHQMNKKDTELLIRGYSSLDHENSHASVIQFAFP